MFRYRYVLDGLKDIQLQGEAHMNSSQKMGGTMKLAILDPHVNRDIRQERDPLFSGRSPAWVECWCGYSASTREGHALESFYKVNVCRLTLQATSSLDCECSQKPVSESHISFLLRTIFIF